MVAVDRRATGEADFRDRGEGRDSENAPSPALGDRGLPPETAFAAQDTNTTARAGAGHRPPLQKRKRTHREAQLEYWRDVRAGRRVRNEHPREGPVDSERNFLLDLPEEQRSKLFGWMRECPYNDTVRMLLRDQGTPEASDQLLENFYQIEAAHHWEIRTCRATEEANALVRLAQESLPKISEGILNALAQETFRQVTKHNLDPGDVSRLATIFLKVRSDNRADQMQELRRRKIEGELEDTLEQAFATLAKQAESTPAARVAFEALQRELLGDGEESE